MRIDFKILKKIIDALDEIHNEEDDDFPNRRSVANFYRGIDNNMKRLGADKNMERDIYDCYHFGDPTYERTCDRLRAKGYEIYNNHREARE